MLTKKEDKGKLLVISEVLGWIGVGILIIVASFLSIGPRFGWEAIPVLSASMEPALRVGGEIITRPVPLEEIKVGDIITFQIEETKVTHRVIEIYPDEAGKPWFQTKGDANEEPDPNLVSSEIGKIRKVVFHIPYLGYFHGGVSNFLTTPLPFELRGKPVPVGFVLYILLILIFTWLIFSWIRKKWKEW